MKIKLIPVELDSETLHENKKVIEEMQDLFENLPNHLHLCRNSNAIPADRWRIFNTVNNKYLEETGASTAIECMQKLLKNIKF